MLQWHNTYLPARISNLATSLADYNQKSSVSTRLQNVEQPHNIGGEGRVKDKHTVDTDDFSHIVPSIAMYSCVVNSVMYCKRSEESKVGVCASLKMCKADPGTG